MERIRRLRNPIREYAWGSHTALAELLGEPAPSPRPQAELWMGAHPGAPSEVEQGPLRLPLADWIRHDPAGVLGPRVAREFGAALPFLLKVIAAEHPLSLQVHPDRAQARAGFERESRAGIPIDAPERSYRDQNAKPELVCALTPFAAMCGFRELDEIVAQVDELRARGLAALLGRLRFEREPAELRAFFERLMGLSDADAAILVAEAVVAAESGYGEPEVRGWLRKLADVHPGDRGALAPLFLNLLELRPGEALFLPAGQLHSYLHGSAVEIMASSDNVLRGGLTRKHVDVSELLATLHFEPRRPEVQAPRADAEGEVRYRTPAREFALSAVELAPGRSWGSGARDGVEIVFCAAGAVAIEGRVAPEDAALAAGEAVIVPAAAGPYRVGGAGTIYRAAVPATPDG